MKYIKFVTLIVLFLISCSPEKSNPTLTVGSTVNMGKNNPTLVVVSAVNMENGYDSYESVYEGCNWYEAEADITISASSFLTNDGKNSYIPKNAHDGNRDTSWVEGKSDQGIGESITFKFMNVVRLYPNLTVNGFMISNGYVKSKNLWLANSRVKSMTMVVNGKDFADIRLNDFYGFQQVNFADVKLPLEQNIEIKFIVTDIYPGEKYSDTSISDFVFLGTGWEH